MARVAEARPRFTPLDGMRGFGMLAVFTAHVDSHWDSGAYIVVDIFFAFSGYLITLLLLREFRRDGDISISGFYIRRFLRLMPALVVGVLVIVPVALLEGMPKPIANGLATITYVMDFYAPRTWDHGGIFGHTWSLGVEEQFYLVWPLILVWALRRRVRLDVVIGIVMLGLMAASFPLSLRYGMTAVYRTPFPHVPALGVGVLLALFVGEARGGGARRVERFLANRAVGWGSTVILVAAIISATGDQRWLYAGGFLGFDLLIVIMLANVLLAPKALLARIFAVKPAVWLGQRSYGFYLWHYPVILILGRHFHSLVVVGGVGFVVTLAITIISWSVVEQPFLRLKERFEPARPVLVSPEPSPA